MRRYNLEVLEISKTHWTQVGQQRLASEDLLLYSGHDEENSLHTQGVALMLSKQAQNALIGWESHGPRTIKATFKTKKEGISMKVIQCYVPTKDCNEDAKDKFYVRPTDSFEVTIGVRQGCLLSSLLFLLVIDWIMKTSTSEGKHGIQWTSRI
ncbi:unnamed protein product [Schistosoma margrebowiei]|uniref:Uncharacterized protein n=1 Tax=Schistosoma margrebowiei TaxID=48269 RepID=A0A183LN28_9TREM|nr:unnamed protein product [Schistosoma margrebowiei]